MLGLHFLQQPQNAKSKNKACERCGRRKQKCDGRLPCSNCKKLVGEECRYVPRKQRPKRQDQKHPQSMPYLRSPSMAKGFISMDEGRMITSYMQCMGPLRLMTESEVRSAMILLTSWRSRASNGGAGGLGDASLRLDRQAIRERCDLCVFYCVVALGGLMEGRPIKKVTYLVQVANTMLKPCHKEDVKWVARAYIALACVHGFEGQGVPCEGPAAGYVDRAQKICAQDVSSDDVGSSAAAAAAEDEGRTCNDSSEEAPMEWARLVRHGDKGVTDANLAFLPGVQDLPKHARQPVKALELMGDESIASFVVSSGHAIRNAVLADLRISEASAEAARRGSPERGYNLRRCLEKSLGSYNELEAWLDRKGLVGLIANGQLAMVKAWQKDVQGVLDRTCRCVDIIVAFEGCCRSQSGLHIAHSLASVLHDLGAREQYEEVRRVFRNMWEEEKEIPLFDEWRGVHDICTHDFCRALEYLYPEGWNVVPRKPQYAGPQLPSMGLMLDPAPRAPAFAAPAHGSRPVSDGPGDIPCRGLGLDSPTQGGGFFGADDNSTRMEGSGQRRVALDAPSGFPDGPMGMEGGMTQGTMLKGDGWGLLDNSMEVEDDVMRGAMPEEHRLESSVGIGAGGMQGITSGHQGLGLAVDPMRVKGHAMAVAMPGPMSGVHGFGMPVGATHMGGGGIAQEVALEGRGFADFTVDPMGINGGAMPRPMPGVHGFDMLVGPARMGGGITQEVALNEQGFVLTADPRDRQLGGMQGAIPEGHGFDFAVDTRRMDDVIEQGLALDEQAFGGQIDSRSMPSGLPQDLMGMEKEVLDILMCQDTSDEEESGSSTYQKMR